jgi:hypothetical protein
MNVELTSSEVELLASILKARLGDYSMQIADADQYEFKERLRGERDELAAIVAKLNVE